MRFGGLGATRFWAPTSPICPNAGKRYLGLTPVDFADSSTTPVAASDTDMALTSRSPPSGERGSGRSFVLAKRDVSRDEVARIGGPTWTMGAQLGQSSVHFIQVAFDSGLFRRT
jgi:hypothetical protein